MLTTAGVEHGPTRVERHQQSLFETRDQLVAPWQAKPRRSTPQAPNTQMQTEGHRFANHHFVLRGQSDRSVESSLANRSGICLLYTSPSPRDRQKSRMPSSA